MKSKTKINTMALMVYTILSFAGLALILFMVNTDLVRAINVPKETLDSVQYLIGISHLVVLIFHPLVILYIFSHYRRFKEMGIFKMILLVVAVLSLFSMGVEKVMTDEIARQYRNGMSINEIHILNSAYIFNVALCLLTLVFLLRTLKLIALSDSGTDHVDDGIFISSLCLGMVAGIAGIYLTLRQAHANVEGFPFQRLWGMVPFYIMILSPFVLALFYWFIVKRRQSRRNWLDEKQVQDMLRAALVTLILSVPGLSLLWIHETPHMFFVLFYYIFMALAVFSASTLYFFRFKG